MCGIAGISLKNPNDRLSKDFLKISNFLSHRGPDSKGFFQNSRLTIIHTRLSIIDVSGGKQPIKNDDLVLAVNGEIYNDLEIRKKNKDFNFKTNSDSESILAVYRKYGLEGFKHLRGMYAFSLYDKKINQLILCRDEFGIKPLYFSIVSEGIIYSSEIQALRAVCNSEQSIKKNKLSEFLQMQFCSGNETIFKNIFRLRPGERLVIREGQIIKSKVFSPLSSVQNSGNAIDDKFISKTLLDSVKVHQRSDVPYCLFFSGGVDSMLILYFMNKLNKSRIKSFRVKFEGQNDISSEYFKSLSNSFNTEFEDVNFTENDFWKYLPLAAKFSDDPVADYAMLPTLKLAKRVSEQDFKVVLSGEGGDEIFAGYGRYKRYFSFFRNKYFKGSFNGLTNLDKKVDNWDFDLKKLSENVNNLSLSKLQKHQWFDFNNWLPNDLLIKLDRCLMAYGLEGRTPLIDKEVFRNFFLIDDKYKISKNTGKFYIKSFLQKEIEFYDPFKKKKGFTVPIKTWIPKKINLIQKILPKVELIREFFSKKEILELCYISKNNKNALRPLWHLIFISCWYAIHIQKIKTEGNFFDLMENLR